MVSDSDLEAEWLVAAAMFDCRDPAPMSGLLATVRLPRRDPKVEIRVKDRWPPRR